MAKNSTPRMGGPARVRLVVIDAEIPDGDINGFSQVLQNALRTQTTTVVQRVNGNGAAKTLAHQPTADFEDVEDVEDVVNDAQVDVTPARPRAPRKPPKAPDIVDIDMESDVSLKTFAGGKDSGSQHKKFMIAAAWLKEHRQTNAVGAGHIYTCFRSMEWAANIPDFWQPLRDLKAKKYFVKNDSGEYEINHIGLGFVKKLGGNNGTE